MNQQRNPYTLLLAAPRTISTPFIDNFQPTTQSAQCTRSYMALPLKNASSLPAFRDCVQPTPQPIHVLLTRVQPTRQPIHVPLPPPPPLPFPVNKTPRLLIENMQTTNQSAHYTRPHTPILQNSYARSPVSEHTLMERKRGCCYCKMYPTSKAKWLAPRKAGAVLNG